MDSVQNVGYAKFKISHWSNYNDSQNIVSAKVKLLCVKIKKFTKYVPSSGAPEAKSTSSSTKHT